MFVHTQWLYLEIDSVLKHAQADQDKYMHDLWKFKTSWIFSPSIWIFVPKMIHFLVVADRIMKQI